MEKWLAIWDLFGKVKRIDLYGKFSVARENKMEEWHQKAWSYWMQDGWCCHSPCVQLGKELVGPDRQNMVKSSDMLCETHNRLPSISIRFFFFSAKYFCMFFSLRDLLLCSLLKKCKLLLLQIWPSLILITHLVGIYVGISNLLSMSLNFYFFVLISLCCI